jgi:hypothetical protein
MRKPKKSESTCIKANAEKELGALLAAVRQVFGDGEVERPADLWLSALENLDWNGDYPARVFRQITIHSASRLTEKYGNNVSKSKAVKDGGRRQ